MTSIHDNNQDDIHQLKREIILLKRQLDHIRFKNSALFKTLNFLNHLIFIIYLQYIVTYVFDIQPESIDNKNIQFKIYPYESERIKLYTISFKYKNYTFRVKINKEFDRSISYSDAEVSKDLFFQIPQKLRFVNYRHHWYLVNDSLGILTICSIIVFTQIVVYVYKQNEYYYSLLSISALSIISFISISVFAMSIHNII